MCTDDVFCSVSVKPCCEDQLNSQVIGVIAPGRSLFVQVIDTHVTARCAPAASYHVLCPVSQWRLGSYRAIILNKVCGPRGIEEVDVVVLGCNAMWTL
jgi:hypothetical protein